MKKALFYLLFGLSLTISAAAQQDEASWVLERTENGINAYTRLVDKQPYKEFKLETVLLAPMDSIIAVLENVVASTEKDPYITHVELIGDKNEKEFVVYFQIRTPFFSKDRDLVLKYASSRTQSGYIQYAKAEPNLVSLNPDFIRIPVANYITSVHSLGKDSSLLVYRGTIQPGGNISVGFVNKYMLNSPINRVSEIKALVKHEDFIISKEEKITPEKE